MEIFEKASRLKLRIGSIAGPLSIEELWDLPLQSGSGLNLDSIGQALRQTLKARESDEGSLVSPETDRPVDEAVQLSFDIVKHVIDVKVAERDAAKDVRERAKRKQELLAALADKENEELRGKSADDIRKMIDDL